MSDPNKPKKTLTDDDMVTEPKLSRRLLIACAGVALGAATLGGKAVFAEDKDSDADDDDKDEADAMEKDPDDMDASEKDSSGADHGEGDATERDPDDKDASEKDDDTDAHDGENDGSLIEEMRDSD